MLICFIEDISCNLLQPWMCDSIKGGQQGSLTTVLGLVDPFLSYGICYGFFILNPVKTSEYFL